MAEYFSELLKTIAMTYNIKGTNMLFPIDRTQIIDISVNDTLQIEGFPGARHTWTSHDSELIENNPDDAIFLQIEKVAENKYRTLGILLDNKEYL
jgi:hypothetical protein